MFPGQSRPGGSKRLANRAGTMTRDFKRGALVFAVLLSAAVSSGCGGAQPPTQIPQTLATVQTVREPKAHTLLYIADYYPTALEEYSYPKAKYKKSFTADLDEPQGTCSGAKGDFWVVNSGNNEILGYKHGASKPWATLTETNGSEIGCAQDSVTGNLAVAILSTGDVLVYPNASGTPTTYSTPLSKALYVTYDNDGDLFVDGYTTSNFALVELPKGSGTFITISLNVNFGYASPIEYVAPYLVLGAANSDDMYQFSISGSSGTEANGFHLTGSGDLVAFQVSGDEVAAIGARSSGLWKYPAGGQPIVTIDPKQISNPQGIVISP